MLLHLDMRAYSTLPGILSAISHFHCRYYLPSPTQSQSVTRSLEGAKRLFGSPSVSRKIITKDILDTLFPLLFKLVLLSFLLELFGAFLFNFTDFFALAK